MINEIIVEMAIEGHASTRDAIRWAMAQEREACARVCEERGMVKGGEVFAARIRARNDTSSKRVDTNGEHKHD